MKKIKTLACIIALTGAVSVSGCSEASQKDSTAETAPADQQQPVSTEPAASTPESSSPSAEQPVDANPDQPAAETPQPIENMDEKAVIQLAVDAMSHFWFVSGGGTYPDGVEIESFSEGDMIYRFMGPDLDSNEEILSYLQETYTKEASEQMVQKFNFVERDGRLAQPDVGFGSLLEWEKAQASLIDDKGDIKRYELKVPFGEEGEFEVVMVTVRKVDGIGWRVEEPHGMM